MAVDFYLKIDTIDGESAKVGQSGWIDVLEWKWGLQQTGAFASGGQGGGAGRVAYDDITIIKAVDKSSPKLFQACAAGTHFKKATLIAKKAAGGASGGGTFMDWQFGPVLISGIDNSGQSEGDQLMETITLHFGAMQIRYTEQQSSGAMGKTSIATWSQVSNRSDIAADLTVG